MHEKFTLIQKQIQNIDIDLWQKILGFFSCLFLFLFFCFLAENIAGVANLFFTHERAKNKPVCDLSRKHIHAKGTILGLVFPTQNRERISLKHMHAFHGALTRCS